MDAPAVGANRFWRVCLGLTPRAASDVLPAATASTKAGPVLPPAMLKRPAAFQRQNQLDFAHRTLWLVRRPPQGNADP